MADTCIRYFQSTPVDIVTYFDYSKRIGFIPNVKLQGDFFTNIGFYTCNSVSWTTLHPMQFFNKDTIPIFNTFPTNRWTYTMSFIQIFRIVYSKTFTTKNQYYKMLDQLFANGKILCSGDLWDDTNGCGHQYHFWKAYYFLTKVL